MYSNPKTPYWPMAKLGIERLENKALLLTICKSFCIKGMIIVR